MAYQEAKHVAYIHTANAYAELYHAYYVFSEDPKILSAMHSARAALDSLAMEGWTSKGTDEL